MWSAGSTGSRTWTSLRCSAAASPRMTRRSVSTSDSNSSSLGSTWNSETSVALVVAALDHVLQLEDAAELEPEHGGDDRRLGRRLAAEHADHPERPHHLAVGADVDHVDAVHRHLAVDGADLGRAHDPHRVVGEGAAWPPGRRRGGSVAMPRATTTSSPDHPAAPLEDEVVVEQPLEQVGPLGHLVGRVAEGGVGPEAGGGGGHLLPHGQEVAGGGEHVGQDGLQRGHQGPAGLGGHPDAQLDLQERLPVLGVAGGEDGGEAPVGRPLAAEDGVEHAGDLVAEPVQLLSDPGGDELAVVAADLDDGADGVPAVDGHPGVDQPDP